VLTAADLRQRGHDLRMLGRSTLVAFAVLWAGLITWLSAQPARPTDTGGFASHVLFNAGHAPLFGFLAAGLAFALGAGVKRPIPEWSACALAFPIAIAFGAIDEWHQTHVPGRTSSWTDVVTDGVGAALTLLCIRYLASPRSTFGGFLLRVVVGAAAMLAAGALATSLDPGGPALR
jgi:VanZ like protein